MKMAEVLCVYREVAVLRASEAAAMDVVIISYGEKPGIQVIGTTASDLPPQPGSHPTFARDHEYERLPPRTQSRSRHPSPDL